jgi:acetylornithine deacetylase/succinyl-diaminopimelate desuccinylase-like protein
MKNLDYFLQHGILRGNKSGGIPMSIDELKCIIDEHFTKSIEAIVNFLKIPNVITDPKQIKEAIEFIKRYIEEMGGKAEVRDYGELPILYGELDEGADKTVIIYKNFDIVAPEASGWRFNPFGANISCEGGVGDVIYARGAAAPKGPLMCLLTAIKAYKEAKKRLPVNIKFIFESDEQLGSPTLPKLIEDEKEQLSGAIVGIYPEFNQTARGEAIIPLSVKGIIYFELICKGGDWGGPSVVSLHSSNAAWIKSPVWRMIQALSTMIDANENILIAGFHDGITKYTYPKELISYERIKDMIEFMKNFTVQFKESLSEEELFIKYVSSPTLNISSLITVPSRRWMKFVLPHEVRAHIDIRLVPDMDPDKVIKSIREHLDGYGFKDIELLLQMKYPAWHIDFDNEMVQLLANVYKELGFSYGILPSSGTALPLYVFDKILNKPLIVAGLGKGGRAYHINEYLPLSSIKNFQLSITYLLETISKYQHKK